MIKPALDRQDTPHWRLRDTIAAALLFLGTAVFVLWQNARVAVLWDLGYLLDTSWRIALGQMPYRDFPLVHAPLTFLVQAGLMRLGGRHYLIPVLYAAVAGGLGTVIAWRIVLRLLRPAPIFDGAAWLVAFVLSPPLTVLGIYSVYPHPIYDCDCALAILFALFLLVRLETHEESYTPQKAVGALLAGAASVVPLFFKQNMGLPFLAIVAAGMIVLLALRALRACSLRLALQSQPGMVLVGMAVALLAAVALIAATAGLGNYLHWTVQFAAQRRLPGMASMLAVYQQPSLLWMVPVLAAGLVLCHTRIIARWWGKGMAAALIVAPFAGSLIYLLFQDDADERADSLLALWPLLLLAALVTALFELRRGPSLGRLIPFFVLAAIHGTFLSQQLWGSTYALWPLLMLLVASFVAALPTPARSMAITTAVVASATFLICGGLYAISLERLSYIQIPEAPIAHSSTPALRSMATRGDFLGDLDELVSLSEHEIPKSDPLILLPGEDPFYYATGRTQQFPVTLFDPTTDPYTARELIDEARRRNVRWVIVKRKLQINTNPLPESDQTLRLVGRDFALYRRLQGYDVYRRR